MNCCNLKGPAGPVSCNTLVVSYWTNVNWSNKDILDLVDLLRSKGPTARVLQRTGPLGPVVATVAHLLEQLDHAVPLGTNGPTR